jgi:hypothetical protein
VENPDPMGSDLIRTLPLSCFFIFVANKEAAKNHSFGSAPRNLEDLPDVVRHHLRFQKGAPVTKNLILLA